MEAESKSLASAYKSNRSMPQPGRFIRPSPAAPIEPSAADPNSPMKLGSRQQQEPGGPEWELLRYSSSKSLPPLTRLALPSATRPNSATEPSRYSSGDEESDGDAPITLGSSQERKAQNRASQRAFRSRRAARISQLEKGLEQEQEAHAKRNRELEERSHALELELQSFISRSSLLEEMLRRERKEQARARKVLDALRASAGDSEEQRT